MERRDTFTDKRLRFIIGVWGEAADVKGVVRYEVSWLIRAIPQLESALPVLRAYDQSSVSDTSSDSVGGIAMFTAYPDDVFLLVAQLEADSPTARILLRQGACPSPEAYDYELLPSLDDTYGITLVECNQNKSGEEQQWFVSLYGEGGTEEDEFEGLVSKVSRVQLLIAETQGTRKLDYDATESDWKGQCALGSEDCAALLTLNQTHHFELLNVPPDDVRCHATTLVMNAEYDHLAFCS